MEKILITGVSGFVGQVLAARLNRNYEIIGVDLDKTASNLCNVFYNSDVTESKSISEIVNTHLPSVIIHAAAIKDLLKCESEKERAYRTNTESTINIYNLAKEIKSKFIFISSDQVFGGGNAYSEPDSLKDPINYYGITKSAAEDAIFKEGITAICRTALVFGNVPVNQLGLFADVKNRNTLGVQGFIVDHVRYRLSHGEGMFLSSEEYCNPTSAELLAKQIHAVIKNKLSGIFHCCGGERISRYDFGLRIAQVFGLNENLINPNPARDALRPKDVSLSVVGTECALGFKFPMIDEMLRALK
jgi:dTDP-4-dehydrorhamnose reductase